MVSLVATVLNEKENLEQWLDSLFHQTRVPDEIVIVDGGSTDGTWDMLVNRAKMQPILKVFKHESNIAAGRNFAVQQAKGDIIAVADAGCSYAQNWLEKLVAPLITGGSFSCTAFSPMVENNKMLMALFAAVTTPAPAEFQKDWLPSSRSVAFTKKLWLEVGGYPEWLPYCEDVIFDLNIIKKKIKPAYIREPLVIWKPRQTVRAFLKQLYNYTRSDGHGKLFFGRQLVRYVVYGGAIIGTALFGGSTIWWVLLGLAGAAYMVKFWKRWFVFARQSTIIFQIFGALALPCMVALGDVAKMVGWPIGVLERWSGKVKYQKL